MTKTKAKLIPNNSPVPRQRAGRRVSLSLDTSGGANRADAAGANINVIVAQYKKTGTLPAVSSRNPLYGDFTFGEDIHEVREAVFEAEQRFNQLPADVRTLCDNDWVQFMDRFDDPHQRQALMDAGLSINSSKTDLTPPKPSFSQRTGTAPKNSDPQTLEDLKKASTPERPQTDGDPKNPHPQ